MTFPHITSPSGPDGPDEPDPDPTSTNIISGNVLKLGLPFQANIVAVSLNTASSEPEVLGSTTSDIITGDYSIDVYPHVDEVLIYVAPDYGRAFSEGLLMTAGQLIHPTVPNKHVYRALNDGELGAIEPNWVTEGTVFSDLVEFEPVPLHRPLMNGFVKPIITPI